MTTLSLGPSPHRRDVLARRIRLFVTATISYNVDRGSGRPHRRNDGVFERADRVRPRLGDRGGVGGGGRLAVRRPGSRSPGEDRAEGHRLLVLRLAAFVTVDALRSLLGGVEAQHSTVGLILAAVSLAVMPLLSYGQRRTGRELGSRSAVADSKQTLLCTYLSAVLLIGLGLNWLFGWSWADPIAALIIAGIAIREGIEAWRGDPCCNPVAALHPTR